MRAKRGQPPAPTVSGMGPGRGTEGHGVLQLRTKNGVEVMTGMSKGEHHRFLCLLLFLYGKGQSQAHGC